MKHKIKYLSFILLIIVTVSSCRKDEVAEIFETPKTLLNESYGSDGAQKMDIYLPAHRSSQTTKVLLVIHGGGWVGGDKSDMQPFVPKMQSALPNYAIVNMNYRLADLVSRYMLPMQTDDIQSVVDFLKNKSAEYGIKPEFVVLGLSAGGHLAMYYSYRMDVENRVKAVVNIVGPSNLNDTHYLNNWVFSNMMTRITDPGNLPSGMPQSVYGSPIQWITNRSQPTISFYGNADDLIPASQHASLEQGLNKAGVKNEKYVYEGGHDIGGTNTDDIIAKIKAFLSANVK